MLILLGMFVYTFCVVVLANNMNMLVRQIGREGDSVFFFCQASLKKFCVFWWKFFLEEQRLYPLYSIVCNPPFTASYSKKMLDIFLWTVFLILTIYGFSAATFRAHFNSDLIDLSSGYSLFSSQNVNNHSKM